MSVPHQPNAKCDKCALEVRFSRATISVIRNGYSRHAKCGGLFVEIKE